MLWGFDGLVVGETDAQEELQQFAESLKGTNGLACMAKTYKVSAEFLRSIVYAADADGDGCVIVRLLDNPNPGHLSSQCAVGRLRRSGAFKHSALQPSAPIGSLRGSTDVTGAALCTCAQRRHPEGLLQ
jgi:hypothetical protein